MHCPFCKIATGTPAVASLVVAGSIPINNVFILKSLISWSVSLSDNK